MFGRDFQRDAFLFHSAHSRARWIGQHLIHVLLSRRERRELPPPGARDGQASEQCVVGFSPVGEFGADAEVDRARQRDGRAERRPYRARCLVPAAVGSPIETRSSADAPAVADTILKVCRGGQEHGGLPYARYHQPPGPGSSVRGNRSSSAAKSPGRSLSGRCCARARGRCGQMWRW